MFSTMSHDLAHDLSRGLSRNLASEFDENATPLALFPEEKAEQILEYTKRMVILSLMSEEEKGKMTLVPSKSKEELIAYTKEEIIELKEEEENLRKKSDWTPENRKRREEILLILKQNPWKEEWDAPPCCSLIRSTTECHGKVFSSSAGTMSVEEYKKLRGY
jgi:hypothetical protein